MDRIIRLVNYGEHTIIRVKQKQEKRKSRLVEKKKNGRREGDHIPFLYAVDSYQALAAMRLGKERN